MVVVAVAEEVVEPDLEAEELGTAAVVVVATPAVVVVPPLIWN